MTKKKITAEQVLLEKFVIEFDPELGGDKFNTIVTVTVSIDGEPFTRQKTMWLFEADDYLSKFGVTDL